MIAGFARALYDSGLPVVLRQTLDAHRAAELIGLGNRSLLKEGLRAVFVKRMEDERIFDECFERYFSPASERDDDGDGDPAHDGGEENGEETMAMSPAEGGLQRGAIAFALMRAASRIGLERIEIFTQRGLYARRLLEEAGLEDLEAALRGARDEGREADARILARQRDEMVGEARALVDRALDLHTRRKREETRDDALSSMALAEASAQDLAIMQRVVRRLAKRLAVKHGRQTRRALRARIDMARTLRRNVAHDGLLFEIVGKTRRVSKPQLFVICDVSGSVAAAAKFLLMFLYALKERVSACRSFAFSARLADVSALLDEREFSDAFPIILRKHGGGSTDYGQAFRDFEELAGRDITRRSAVIILGDARSNYGDPGAEVVRRLSAKVARLLWINPEPQSLWGTGDSEMPRLGAACDAVYPCATISEMERIIDGVLKIRV